MSNIKKWCEAILQVDTDKMSITSVRNIQLIKQEFERLQQECEGKEKEIAELKQEFKANYFLTESLYKEISELEAEKERLKGLIEKQFIEKERLVFPLSQDWNEKLQKFKTENNL